MLSCENARERRAATKEERRFRNLNSMRDYSAVKAFRGLVFLSLEIAEVFFSHGEREGERRISAGTNVSFLSLLPLFTEMNRSLMTVTRRGPSYNKFLS